MKKETEETVESLQNEVLEDTPEVGMSRKEEAQPELSAAETLQKQYDEVFDKWQRSLAEFDNFRKRTVKEKAGMYDLGVRDAVEKLLPVVDSFERAIAAAPDKSGGFYTGVEMIYRQFIIALTDIGVDVLPSVGEKFDPCLHHAVAHVEDAAYGENEVVEELQKGYIYKEKVIRHCMVKVAN